MTVLLDTHSLSHTHTLHVSKARAKQFVYCRDREVMSFKMLLEHNFLTVGKWEQTPSTSPALVNSIQKKLYNEDGRHNTVGGNPISWWLPKRMPSPWPPPPWVSEGGGRTKKAPSADLNAQEELWGMRLPFRYLRESIAQWGREAHALHKEHPSQVPLQYIMQKGHKRLLKSD